MEILKTTRWAGFKPEVYTAWVKWVNDLLMPQMENYVYSITAKVLSQRVRFPHNLSNWHSTIAGEQLCYCQQDVCSGLRRGVADDQGIHSVCS